MLFTTREKKTKTRKEAPRKRRLRRTRHKDTDRTRDWKRKRKNRISRIDTRFSSVLLLEEEEGFIITFHYFQEYVHTHISSARTVFWSVLFFFFFFFFLLEKGFRSIPFESATCTLLVNPLLVFFFIGLFLFFFPQYERQKEAASLKFASLISNSTSFVLLSLSPPPSQKRSSLSPKASRETEEGGRFLSAGPRRRN